MLLYVVIVCCCMLLLCVVVCCCMLLLYVVVCCCMLLLYVVVCCYCVLALHYSQSTISHLDSEMLMLDNVFSILFDKSHEIGKYSIKLHEIPSSVSMKFIRLP